ncbi:non-ribosomal peptide synthetase [Amycolatopsis eburnea]|uniref:Amino acid adenylation domain-containing protein n=1 Tax=Amycolatopsis eburnea TaxID=2267691 RepID=A0A427SV00_9PSEU|nr:non-ribosomal peptide synthetase [Amycolatopsis eburnea]RSD07770.1 amino acid adenylation domain-containing protein [Amycolatopsis eburnea]
MTSSSGLHELFTAQARCTPDRIAVTDGRRELTYRELDEAADRLASRLRAAGVGPGVLAGVCADRDADLVVALLGVLKAGGGYVPLDPRYPADRLGFVLADCRCPVVTGQRRFADRVPGVPFVALDDGAAAAETKPAAVRPDDTAYVIHTSGSTGRPKGVVVSHANVTRLFEVTRAEFGVTEDDTWTLFHSYAFDFSVWELWGALLHGGRVVVVPYEVSRDPEAFWRLLAEQRVTVLSQTPSAFRQLIRAAAAAGWPDTALRLVVFGGEALEPAALEPWFDRYGDRAPRLVNMYGITETTVHVTARPLTREDTAGAGSPIGAPLDDLRVSLLDADLRPVPPGEPGEVYVGGAGVAGGYLGRPGLTADRFVPDPAGPPGGRRYRTGDLAAVRDGELTFLGRVDDQIQFRGFRVEPAEIEAALTGLPGVSAAAVVLQHDQEGEAHLAGFVVAEAGPREVRAALAGVLPAHLVPSTITALDALPLTANGKLDRAALRDRGGRAEESTVDATGSPAEVLAGIWAGVLGVGHVGPDDDFFALGGDSMTAIRVVSKAREAGIALSVHGVFQHPTIAGLIASGVDGAAESAPQPASDDDVYPASLLQVGLIYECEITEDPTLYHDLSAVRLSGPLDEGALRRALDAVSGRHELLRTSFDLVGHAEPMQQVHAAAPIPLTLLDAPAAAGPAEALEQWWAEQWRRPFDLAEAPLARCHVLRHADGTWHLAVSVHHSVVDGWSFAVVLADLLQAYDHELGGSAPIAAPPAARYRDFVVLERKAATDPETAAYWKSALDGYSPVPLWTNGTGDAEATLTLPLAASLTAQVRRLAVQTGVPPKSVYLAAHLRMLGELTGTTDVLTGLVSNGRPEHSGAEAVVGMFVTTLPLRLELPGGPPRALVRAAFEAERAHLPHRHFPPGELRAATGFGPPDALFNYADFRAYDGVDDVRAIRAHEWWFGDRNGFPLSMTVSRRPAAPEWDLSVRVAAGHGGAALAETASGLLLAALGGIVADPDGTRGGAK